MIFICKSLFLITISLPWHNNAGRAWVSPNSWQLKETWHTWMMITTTKQKKKKRKQLLAAKIFTFSVCARSIFEVTDGPVKTDLFKNYNHVRAQIKIFQKLLPISMCCLFSKKEESISEIDWQKILDGKSKNSAMKFTAHNVGCVKRWQDLVVSLLHNAMSTINVFSYKAWWKCGTAAQCPSKDLFILTSFCGFV